MLHASQPWNLKFVQHLAAAAFHTSPMPERYGSPSRPEAVRTLTCAGKCRPQTGQVVSIASA
eukprot:526510-Amphidinium_carterae.1